MKKSDFPAPWHRVYRVTIFRLPSLIILYPYLKLKLAQHVPEKAGVKVSMNTAADVIQWRAHTAWLTCMEITIFIAEVTTVFVNKMNGPMGL